MRPVLAVRLSWFSFIGRAFILVVNHLSITINVFAISCHPRIRQRPAGCRSMDYPSIPKPLNVPRRPAEPGV